MVMIMVMIVMLPSRMRGWLQTGRSRSLRLKGWGILLGYAADCAEPVFYRVLAAAGEAGTSLDGFGRGARGGIRVYLRSKALNCLQRSRNCFVTGLGMMQVLLQSPEEIVDGGVLRQFSLRPRRGRIPPRSALFFMIHSAAGPLSAHSSRKAGSRKGNLTA